MSDTAFHFLTDETGKEMVAALRDINAMSKGASIEYGYRRPVGSSASGGERVIRQNGIMSQWNITFTRNVNNDNANCPFSMIDLFAPSLWTDNAGNVFRRFSRFYYCKETVGNYEYWWVCRTQATPEYKLPKAFLPNWKYVDIGVYEGGDDPDKGNGYLCSKSGATLARSMTRTVAFNRAKAWHSQLGITDFTREFYCITTMSEITEILQPLLVIQMASINSDVGYAGHRNNSWAESNLLNPGQTDVIAGLHGTVADDGLHSFKMLGIENIWGNQWDHILDCTILDYVPYVCANLQNWNDTTTPNTDAAFGAANYSVLSTSGQYISKLGYDAGHSDIALPIAGSGSSATYYGDYYWINSGARTVFFGGYLNDGSIGGLFYWNLGSDVGYSYWHYGARLSHRSL